MDAQTFQSKYGIDLGTTFLVRDSQAEMPLHYHISDGYNHDVIKHSTSDNELRTLAKTIVYLHENEPEMMEEVLDDLKALQKKLFNPYRA